jgi:hypothetical protein
MRHKKLPTHDIKYRTYCVLRFYFKLVLLLRIPDETGRKLLTVQYSSIFVSVYKFVAAQSITHTALHRAWIAHSL